MDWDSVWKEAITAAEDILDDASVEASKHARKILQAREDRLRQIIEMWARGDLDEETLEDELEEERQILKMEMLAMSVLAKKTAENAVNAIFKVIGNALKQGIDVLV